MKQFMSFVRKEFYHIFRDKTTMAILLILPILMLVLFGYSISTEVKNSKIAILDSSNDVATRAIIEKFRNSEYFSVKKMVNNPSEIQDLFKKDRLNMVLVFGDNFYENLAHTGNAQVQLIVDGSDPNSAKTIVTYATSIIGAYQLELSKIEDSVSNKSTNKIALQPTNERCLQFCSGCNGYDTYADLCHDDFHLHCPRKRTWHNGSFACITNETYLYHTFQNHSLFRFVAGKFSYHFTLIRLPAQGSNCRELVLVDCILAGLYFCKSIVGVVDFFDSRLATGGSAYLGNGAYVTGHYAIRNDVSGRKYAGFLSMDFANYPREMVYYRGQKNHD